MNLETLLSSPVALPSIPRVIALVLAELDKDDPDLRKISSLLAREPVMTARLLQVANSAQFQLTRPAGTVAEALAVLGLTQVREIALAAAVASAFRQVGGVDMQQFWRYSLNTAKLTRKLSFRVKWSVSPHTVGLVHALGELVMMRGIPQEMSALNMEVHPFSPGRAAVERDRLGFSYAQVGAGFARAWNLPHDLVETLDHHDLPFARGGYEPMACALHLAAWRCRSKEMGYGSIDMAETFPEEAALAMGMDMDELIACDPEEWATPQEVAAFA